MAWSFGLDSRGSGVPHEAFTEPLQRREAFGPLTAGTGDPGSHSPDSSPRAHGPSTFAAGVEEVESGRRRRGGGGEEVGDLKAVRPGRATRPTLPLHAPRISSSWHCIRPFLAYKEGRTMSVLIFRTSKSSPTRQPPLFFLATPSSPFKASSHRHVSHQVLRKPGLPGQEHGGGSGGVRTRDARGLTHP